jgi:hypothetical protein
MKKVLSLLFLLFALNSACVAEIMEDYRIACKNTDGKNLCKAVHKRRCRTHCRHW